MNRRALRTRRRGRQLAVQMVSCRMTNAVSAGEAAAQVAALTRASERNLAAARPLADAAWKSRERIERLLAETARPYWVEHMGQVERCVLHVAVAELLLGATPPRVVLTEAVELARRFSGDQATPFVHAVLDAAARRIGGGDGGGTDPRILAADAPRGRGRLFRPLFILFPCPWGSLPPP